MANTKISQLTPNTNPNGNEEFVYAYNNANGKITLDTMKTYIDSWWGSYTAWTWIDITAWVISNTWVISVNWQTGNVIVSWWGWQTQYDYSAMQWPCSTWYHIPSQWEWQALYNAWITMSAWTSSWTTEWRTYLKMPTTWIRGYNDGAAWQQTNRWRYWTVTPYQTEDAYCISFSWTVFNFALNTHRANAVMIRPFKDTPAIPDITWTTLYDWSWTAAWAWIFYNSWLWLISISADWETWITIADKNLWATAVYNYWDTLAATNVWTYFQWWNNYWFAYSWAVTTSWTQVDASTYWPWNYYSSSTFITWNNDWSSVQNDNLWWYVTWPTPVTSWWIIELTADANIWELPEWIYVTDYDLYYTTWNKISLYTSLSATHRQMLFVTQTSAWVNWFLVYNLWSNSTYTYARAAYWYSKSSADWAVNVLKEWDASLREYWIATWQTVAIEAIWSGSWVWFTQLVENMDWTNPLDATLRVDWTLYSWVVYTVIINSVDQNYTIALWTWVTNPLNVALPSNSNKKCVITMVATSSSTAIVSWCTIWA